MSAYWFQYYNQLLYQYKIMTVKKEYIFVLKALLKLDNFNNALPFFTILFKVD